MSFPASIRRILCSLLAVVWSFAVLNCVAEDSHRHAESGSSGCLHHHQLTNCHGQLGELPCGEDSNPCELETVTRPDRVEVLQPSFVERGPLDLPEYFSISLVEYAHLDISLNLGIHDLENRYSISANLFALVNAANAPPLF